jgi:predicted CopG family antitoxin
MNYFLIKISEKAKEELVKLKITRRDTYDEVILRLVKEHKENK